jgi:hypothetical protein
MIIYHAALCDEEFVLWGETPEDRAIPAILRSRRRKSDSEVMLCPYDAGVQALEAFSGEFSASRASAMRCHRRGAAAQQMPARRRALSGCGPQARSKV